MQIFNFSDDPNEIGQWLISSLMLTPVAEDSTLCAYGINFLAFCIIPDSQELLVHDKIKIPIDFFLIFNICNNT